MSINNIITKVRSTEDGKLVESYDYWKPPQKFLSCLISYLRSFLKFKLSFPFHFLFIHWWQTQPWSKVPREEQKFWQVHISVKFFASNKFPLLWKPWKETAHQIKKYRYTHLFDNNCLNFCRWQTDLHRYKQCKS